MTFEVQHRVRGSGARQSNDGWTQSTISDVGPSGVEATLPIHHIDIRSHMKWAKMRKKKEKKHTGL